MNTRIGKTGMAAIAAMALLFTASHAGAVDRLAQAKKLSAAAMAFPELARIKTQLDALIAGMQTHTEQLSAYRKARVRATDRRYSGLTQSLNRLRTQISELERKLEKTPSLDEYARYTPYVGSRTGYAHARTNLKKSLTLLAAHYDQLLRDIATVRR